MKSSYLNGLNGAYFDFLLIYALFCVAGLLNWRLTLTDLVHFLTDGSALESVWRVDWAWRAQLFGNVAWPSSFSYNSHVRTLGPTSSWSTAPSRRHSHTFTGASFSCTWVFFTFGQGFTQVHDGRHVAVHGGVSMGDGGLRLRQPLSDHAADVGGWDLCESALRKPRTSSHIINQDFWIRTWPQKTETKFVSYRKQTNREVSGQRCSLVLLVCLV